MSSSCQYRQSNRCQLGRYEGTISEGVCKHCISKGENQLGLGDIVALVAEPIRKALNLHKCPSCKSRQNKLNQLTRKKK